MLPQKKYYLLPCLLLHNVASTIKIDAHHDFLKKSSFKEAKLSLTMFLMEPTKNHWADVREAEYCLYQHEKSN